MSYELNHANHKGISFDPVTGNLHALTDANVDINAQVGTAYTLVLDDARKLVTLSNALANDLIVPTNASVAFPLGTVIPGGQLGAGLVTIKAPGVTVNGVLHGQATTTGQFAPFTLTKVGTDSWWLAGDVGAVTAGDPPGDPEPSFTFYRKTDGSGTYANTPHDAAQDIAALDFEMRVRVRAVTFAVEGRTYLAGNYNSTTVKGWTINLETDRRLRLLYQRTAEGTTIFLGTGGALDASLDGQLVWLRLVRDGSTWTFGHSLDGSAWTAGGSRTSADAFVNNDEHFGIATANGGSGSLTALALADSPLEIHRYQLWTGGSASTGTLRVDFDPAQATPGTPGSFVSGGVTWTLNGADYTIVHE